MQDSAFESLLAAHRREWIYELPWPEGKVRAPKEGFMTEPKDWKTDRTILLDLVGRFADEAPDRLASFHPLLGEMIPEDWDVLMYRHLDHHLRQYSA